MHSVTFGGGAARIIHRSGAGGLLDLAVERVRDEFQSSGALLFRGFGVDPNAMQAFAARFSTRFNRDRVRPVVTGTDGYVQMVDEGMGEAPPHCEQANSPFRPDAIWFNCTTPSADGGETLFWDGVRLWASLGDEARRLFGRRKLRFFQRYTPQQWRLFLGPEAELADVGRALTGLEGVSHFVSENGVVYLEFVCPAVVRTRYGGHDAFANSLLSERKNTLGALMSFSDGVPIPDAAVRGVEEAMAGIEEAVCWRPGDLLMLDNSRYLHGRRPFRDRGRRIYSMLSFLNF